MEVVGYNFNKQARAKAIMTIELKDILKNTKIEKKVRPTEQLEVADIEADSYSIKSFEEDLLIVENERDLEEREIPKTIFGDLAPYLEEGMNIACTFLDGTALKAKLPDKVSCRVASIKLRSKDGTSP